MNTATVTRDQARRAIDRLAAKISEFQNAAYQRGMEVGSGADPVTLRAAQRADDDAALAYLTELDRVRALVEGLVESRDRAADPAFMPGPIGGATL